LTAQSLALLSGSVVQGGLIMGFFALGTMPILFAIGVASVKFTERKATTALFMKAAGTLVLFFALVNVNSQLNLLGWPSLSDLSTSSPAAGASERGSAPSDNLAPIVDGKQVIAMQVSSRGYSPNVFTVRAGTPVRWEMTDQGGGGCASAIVARTFFPETVFLSPGVPTVKEFTPTTPGRYKFTCSMGMYSGVIEVVQS
jgi:plastocyanin